MKPIVSIIVPVYNVEKYLNRCVDSIINQSYKDIEIILVNDGSTDNCGKIIDDYKNNDDRVKVIHKENGGLSDARNFGIDVAKGKYLMFIDSDDWVDDKYVETFLNVMIEEKADLVIGKIKSVFNEKNIPINLKNRIMLSRVDAYRKMFLEDGSIISACAKMYKKELFDTLRFEKGKLYEDFLIFDKIIEGSNKIVYIDYLGYYYFIKSNSITRSNFNPNRMVLIDKSKYYIEFCKCKYPILNNAAIRRYVVSCYNILASSTLDKKYNDYSRKIRKEIIKYNNLIFKIPEFTRKDRIQALIINLGVIPYRFSLKLHNFIKYNIKDK